METNYSITIDGKKSIVLGTYDEIETFLTMIYATDIEVRKAKRSELIILRLLKKDIELFDNWKKKY